MAWSEKSGKNSWCVRYERDDGTFGSLSGFTSEDTANAEAARINNENNGTSRTDPAISHIPFGD